MTAPEAPSPMDELIKAGWLIFQRERDKLPCSLLRRRLLILCRETLQDANMPVPLPLAPDDNTLNSDHS